ncbi:MAG: site-specific integrase [Pseudomonadota bacterium]
MRDAAGRIKTRQESFASKDDAFNRYSELLQEQPRKRRQLKRYILDEATVGQVAKAYLESLTQPEPGEDPPSPGTLKGYRSVMNNHVTAHFGETSLRDITSDHFKELYRRINNTRSKNGKPISPRTRSEALRLFEAVLRHGEMQGHIDVGPKNPIKAKRTRSEIEAEADAAERKYYPLAEILTMMEAAEALAESPVQRTSWAWAKYRPMLAFLIYTGARISEARAFRREDYDPAGGRIHIRESAPEGAGDDRTKTIAGRRWVPLNPELAPILEPWMASHDRRYIFGSANDRPVSLTTLYPRFLKVLKDKADEMAAQNPKFASPRRDAAFHGFRHTYASWAVSVGATPKQLQRYMGHKKFSFTMDIYGHLFEDDGQDLAARMTLR